METPPKPPRSGFATPAAVEAGKHIGATKAALDAALPLDLTKPSQAEKDQGVVVCFERREPDGWQLKGQISRGPSGLLLSQLEVLPPTTEDAPHGITTRFLQRIRVEQILDSVRAHAAYEEARRDGTRTILGEEPAPGVFSAGDSQAAQPPRKNAVTEDTLRQVAMEYLRETAAGMPTGALKRLAEHFDRPEKTVQRWIAQARKDGWLGPGARGRSGAEPGYKLIMWLGEQMNSDEALMKDFTARATAMGAEDPAATAAIALRAFRSLGLSDFPRRTGIQPTEVFLVAAKRYERTADEELAARVEAGTDEDEAFEQIAAEIREEIAMYEQQD